ncbi:hypothetical protein Z517_06771 [Fonsecaea pedrosoi CBS 271.37]|uniref:Rhodopsin domain-containing protein n=1 Tax=Fonsecaea pedrosoi CBS 271.37 TaxID=1442368 RepID=A0A0D2DQR6_9EURO|nr:uncharacterized protein Z517_06771 [Fonsecaea pedrosoi CBS 271.37]KIW80156.1 hypothetical protein Z517_06771 [Fonsecaea pedrosoi CBS 271.37]
MAMVNGVLVAIHPPEGYVVDFENPQRRSLPAIYIIAGIGMFLALLFLAQRIYVRLRLFHALGLDDYLVILAWVRLGLTYMLGGLIRKEAAIHAWEMPIASFAEFVKYSAYIQPMIYIVPTMLSKMVLLIFFLKLGNRQKWYIWSIWFTMAVTVGSNIGLLLALAFGCNPIRKSWDITVTGGSCINLQAVYRSIAAFGIVTDVMVFLIPIPMVIGLHLSRAKKAGLFFLFGLGSVTVVTSIVRLYLLIRDFGTLDAPWPGGPVLVGICIEANLLIMCACIPTLKYFVQVVAPNLLGASSAGRSNNANSAGRGPTYILGGQRSGNSTRPRPKSQNYHGFDDGDTGYRMGVLVEGGRPVGVDNSWRNHHDMTDDKDRDDDSAKAIIQTKSIQVHYENRSV